MREIIKGEINKIIKNNSFAGALFVSMFVLAGILFIGFYYSQLHISGENKGDGMELYHKVVKEGTGEFTDEKVRDILADYIDRYQSYDVGKNPFDLFSWEIAATFIPGEENIYMRMNDAIEQNEKITIDQIDIMTIEQLGFPQFDRPLKIGSYVTWHDLFKVTGQLFILISIIAIVICSLVFARDTSSNMNQLLLSTKFGRNKLTISKIMAATLISIFIFIVIHAITLVTFYVYNSGLTGWDISIQTNFLLEVFNFPIEINQLQLYLFALALHFFSVLFIVGITLFVSSITNSPFSSLIVSLGIFFLPAALTELIKRGIVYKLLNLFPINNFKIDSFLILMNAEQEYILDTFIQRIVFTMVVLLIVKIVIDVILYIRMNKYQVQ